MYLLQIALLGQPGKPVPVPRLANELSVSKVSANEMCRKLTDRGLVTYAPYKGVTLTGDGENLARRVLRHRRLWEVFFFEKLGIHPELAEEMACRFEHVTPDALADRLDAFLDFPQFSPQNEPIPGTGAGAAAANVRPLSSLPAGALATVAGVQADPPTREFLERRGICRGANIEVLAVGPDGARLLNVNGQNLSLSHSISEGITTCEPV